MTARTRKAEVRRGKPAQPGIPFVVGIGASAGGLEALDRLFDSMPDQSGIAFVLVQHLSPDHKSLMVELLSKRTAMPVVSAEDGMPVAADTVYILPPGKLITIKGGLLRLSEKTRRDGLVFPIDIFLNSLAEDRGDAAAAIILSGTGSDGTKGVRAIHESEGLVLVQDPKSAGFDGMPRSAMDTGIVDACLPPDALGEHLVGYVRRATQTGHPYKMAKWPAEVDRVVNVLLSQTGMDFSGYKRGTLSRRLDRRMRLNHLDRIDDYAILLAGDKTEAENLHRELLVSVTSFFRDPAAFEALREKVIDPMVANSRADASLRVWVCGCATGEEAYSVTMLFAEAMRMHGRRSLKIFATDADKHALEVAGSGFYPEAVAGDIPQALRERYLIQAAGGFRVVPELRHMLVFAPHNVIKDPPFTKLDLICCRNLLIYLDSAPQSATIRRFQFALKPEGSLFLGASEGLAGAEGDFTAIDHRARLYRVLRPGLPALSQMQAADPLPRRPPTPGPEHHRDTATAEAAQQTLMQAYCPPAVLVDDKLAIQHIFPGAERYLKVPEGEATLNLIRHLPRELGTVVAATAHRALREGKPVTVQPIRLSPDSDLAVQLSFLPVIPANGEPRLAVVFEQPRPAPGETLVLADLQSAAQERIRALEAELRANRESQQAFIEELETTNEEMQAANEELLASNEELQSANEELQSLNEELHTVNSELNAKVEELTNTTDDLDNIISATELGTILVDSKGAVRRFSPSARGAVNLMERDIGRPISDLSTRFTYPDFIEDVQRVLSDGIACEREVPAEGDRTLLARILPYRAGLSKFRGAVITFVDVTPMKAVERRLQLYIDSLPHETAVVDRNGNIVLVNAPWRRFATENDGIVERCGLGRNYFTICEKAVGGEDGATAHAVIEGLRQVLAGQAAYFAIEYPCHAPEEQRWFLMHMAPFPGEDGNVGGAIVTHMNITERRRSEDELRLAARVFESSGESIMITDAAERIVSVNPAFVATTGYAPGDVVGQTPRMLSSGRHDRAFYRRMWHDLSSTGMWRGEVWNKRKSGEIYPEFLNITTVRDLDGKVSHYVAVFSDISAQKRTEETLRHINEELEQFAYVASHDLREPLRMINVYLTLMERKLGARLDDEIREYLEFAADGARRMDKLILDLLDFSRIGRQAETTKVALADIIDRATTYLGPAIAEAGAEIKVDTPLPQVRADEGELVRVVQNIIANAVKYRSPDRAPVIRVSAENNGKMAVISVADNGIGMEAGQLDRIFLMFQRLHARNDYGGGTGIGLAIAKKIIERHGGRIWAESRPGEGSRFIFTLPLG